MGEGKRSSFKTATHEVVCPPRGTEGFGEVPDADFSQAPSKKLMNSKFSTDHEFSTDTAYCHVDSVRILLEYFQERQGRIDHGASVERLAFSYL
jgi:hypothetical protein